MRIRPPSNPSPTHKWLLSPTLMLHFAINTAPSQFDPPSTGSGHYSPATAKWPLKSVDGRQKRGLPVQLFHSLREGDGDRAPSSRWWPLEVG
jgi:hypothetical protein